MRKRFEEELSKLAFGDLDAEEARRLEMQTLSDPEASQAFQTYCRMKEELRSLGEDVPADQLSKERLREAILNRGMKDQLPRTAKPTWIWMPAMAAVLAFGFMFVKGQLPMGGSHAPVVVGNSKIKPDFDVPEFNSKPSPPKTVVKNDRKPSLVVEKEPMTVASNVGSTSRRERYNDTFSNRGDRASEEMLKSLPELDLSKSEEESGELKRTISFESEKGDPATRDMAFAPAPVSTGVPAGRGSATSAPATIVVIQPETDADTGTLKAKEVSSTANVVIGG